MAYKFTFNDGPPPQLSSRNPSFHNEPSSNFTYSSSSSHLPLTNKPTNSAPFSTKYLREQSQKLKAKIDAKKFPRLQRACPFCYSRCSKLKCCLCSFFTAFFISLSIGLLYFHLPLFEADLDTLNNLQFNVANPFSATLAISANFNLTFKNTNYAEVTVLDIDTNVTFQDLIIDISLLDKQLLPRRSTKIANALLAFDISIFDFDTISGLLSSCFDTGVIEFTLVTKSLGKYLGVQSTLAFDPEIFPVDCGFGGTRIIQNSNKNNNKQLETLEKLKKSEIKVDVEKLESLLSDRKKFEEEKKKQGKENVIFEYNNNNNN